VGDVLWCGCTRRSFQVLKNTVACANGHRCCRGCFRRWRGPKLPSGRFAAITDCPMCRVRGPFARAPGVDVELEAQACRCPHVRATTGDACRWTGRYADLPGHVHCFVDPPPPRPGHQQAPPSVVNASSSMAGTSLVGRLSACLTEAWRLIAE